MEKFIITERRGGFGDIFTTLMGTWILAKHSNRDVIIDWRRNPYNWYSGQEIKQKKSGNYIPINSFLTVFDVPKNLCGVNFYLPEHIPDFCIRNDEQNFWDYEDLICLRQECKDVELINNILFSNQRFIRNEIRYGTPCFGSPVDMNTKFYFEENIDLKLFFEHFKFNSYILNLIKKYENYFNNEKICGIHIRHGNNTEITNPLRYPNWIEDNKLLEIVRDQISPLLKENYKFFICTDTEKINNLLLKTIPNSFSLNKEYSLENESCMLLNSRLNCVSSFQEALLDMYFLTRCKKLLFTRASIFTIIPQLYYEVENKTMIF